MVGLDHTRHTAHMHTQITINHTPHTQNNNAPPPKKKQGVRLKPKHALQLIEAGAEGSGDLVAKMVDLVEHHVLDLSDPKTAAAVRALRVALGLWNWGGILGLGPCFSFLCIGSSRPTQKSNHLTNQPPTPPHQ